MPMIAPPTLEPLVAGPLLVDLAGREVTALGRRVYLSAREFDLLATLALEAGRVWSFAELTARVWQLPYLGDSDPVTSAIKRLRKRLAPVRDVEVASVRGVGYRLRVRV
jgi:DNA-binding response OmpR family regulator